MYNIAEYFNRLNRVPERYRQTDRQTTDRWQTDARRHIENLNAKNLKIPKNKTFLKTVRDFNTLPQQTVHLILRTVEAFKQAIVTCLKWTPGTPLYFRVGSSDPTQRSWTIFLTCTCTCTCATVPSRSLYQAVLHLFPDPFHWVSYHCYHCNRSLHRIEVVGIILQRREEPRYFFQFVN